MQHSSMIGMWQSLMLSIILSADMPIVLFVTMSWEVGSRISSDSMRPRLRPVSNSVNCTTKDFQDMGRIEAQSGVGDRQTTRLQHQHAIGSGSPENRISAYHFRP